MAEIYARLLNQYEYKYQAVFLVRFYKLNEDDQVLDEIKLIIKINSIRKSTECNIDSFIVRSQL